MKKLKVISIATLILSAISMIWGIGVVGYYVDDLRIRGTSTALLVTSNTFIWSLVGLVFRELKNINLK